MNRQTDVKKQEKDLAATGKKPKQPPAPPSQQEGIAAFLKGIRTEWGKVSWPTWPQIWGQTLIVLFMTTVMSAGLWLIDNVFHLVISFIVPSH